MKESDMKRVEWRVCCVDLHEPLLGYRITVHCRTVPDAGEPGGWRLVRDVEYRLPSGPLKSDYWKSLLRQAAR